MLAWFAVHLAQVLFTLARVFFNFGLVGQRVARVLSTIGPVALHLAWVLYIFG